MTEAANPSAKRGLLHARPGASPAATPPRRGLLPLGMGGKRDGVLYVPASYDPAHASPLLLWFHGAGGDGRQLVDALAETAEAKACLVVSPDSRGRTWDMILGGYGPDVAFIDGALAQVFETHAVDPGRLAVGGFSDGASYALSIGLINGTLFGDVLAFSPGFAMAIEAHGFPRIFISHGVHDRVLPIDPCSRRLVPALRNGGYAVDYREFDGGHVVPPEMIAAAMARFLG